jgi:hypothetical protein
VISLTNSPAAAHTEDPLITYIKGVNRCTKIPNLYLDDDFLGIPTRYYFWPATSPDLEFPLGKRQAAGYSTTETALTTKRQRPFSHGAVTTQGPPETTPTAMMALNHRLPLLPGLPSPLATSLSSTHQSLALAVPCASLPLPCMPPRASHPRPVLLTLPMVLGPPTRLPYPQTHLPTKLPVCPTLPLGYPL